MTNRELVKLLSKLPDDAEVVVRDDVNDVTTPVVKVRWEAEPELYDSQAIPPIMLVERAS